MNPGFQRSVANYLCDVLRNILPKRFKQWADALAAEIASIDNDGQAMRFAFGGFCGLLPRILIEHSKSLFLKISGSDPSTGDKSTMGLPLNIFHYPRLVGMFSAIIAVTLGLVYMAAAGAPLILLALNFGALAFGLVALALAIRVTPMARRWVGTGTLVMASVLLVTSLFGSSVEGASRWLLVGPFFIQTSLLFLPVMVINFARTRNALVVAGIIIAALAFALQPDRAMAGVLVTGLAGCALYRFDRFVGIALGAATVAFVVTLLRADALPAVPFVDKILYTAFDVHLLAGIAVWVGAAFLLMPTIIGRMTNSVEPIVYSVFGLIWFAVIFAAAVGNYPTPVVGYGSSAIVGYLLSLSALPKYALSNSKMNPGRVGTQDYKGPPGLKRATLFSLVGLVSLGLGSATAEEKSSKCWIILFAAKVHIN